MGRPHANLRGKLDLFLRTLFSALVAEDTSSEVDADRIESDRVGGAYPFTITAPARAGAGGDARLAPKPEGDRRAHVGNVLSPLRLENAQRFQHLKIVPTV